ncbi:MAG: adenosylcobinamide-phosphate synthase CbiB [Eubacteriales bacterium]|nr:adenosylcobinamide-phosphate synthase CbiB [Eubacteriales bacterium]
MRLMLELYAAALWAGLLLDFIIGDPQGWWHPVRTIGGLIEGLEKLLRRLFPAGKGGELAAGGVLAFAVPALSAGAAGAVLWGLWQVSRPVCFAVMCLMNGQLLAARSLRDESMKVLRALETDGLSAARQAVSMIVGRDTASLTEEGVVKAAVETVAENGSDGVVAPMLWMLLAGPAGGYFYKAVNTMDSMVGYKNDRYLYFGRPAARLDDLVNWIPARLTALCFVAAAWLLPGMDGRNAWQIWRRDRRKHKSPNSAQPEAACAGALRVRLAGDASYFGVVQKKPWIGDDLRPIEAEDIRRANKLMYTAAVLAAAISTGTAAALWQLM